MKNIAVLSLLIVLVVGAYLGYAHVSGGAVPTFGLPIGGPAAEVRHLAWSFWEDVRFKDFKKAASYHTKKRQEEVDIPFLLERLFMTKPELLDIMSYEILESEIDSTGLRGRVRTVLRLKDLSRNKLRDQEVILYFHRKSIDSPWYMELETSLREIKGEKGKKH